MKSILIKWVNRSNKEGPERKERPPSSETTRGLISPLGTRAVLRKCQFLIKTRGFDDHFFQRIHTIKRVLGGLAAAAVCGSSRPHELHAPARQIIRAVDNSSVNMPKSGF